MVIPCKEIAHTLEGVLKAHVQQLNRQGIQPKLVTVLLGNSPEQLSFVRIKRAIAERLGITFEFVHYKEIPLFAEFLAFIQQKVSEADTTGIIIQHPLPAGYDPETLYSHIPLEKEIEGHKPGSSFQFPLSLAVLSGLKYVLLVETHHDASLPNIIVDFHKDTPFFQQHLLNKKVIIAGRGPTGGKPITRAFDALGIAYEVVHSQTKHPEVLFRQADIIITAAGKHIITRDSIKKGVVLLNVGLRKEQGKLLGDYSEEAIADTAAYYTETPGGLGPLDVLYLYKNLIEAATPHLS